MATFMIKEKATGRKIEGPYDIYKSLKKLSKADQESVWVIGCDAQNVEIFRECVFKCGIKNYYVDQKVIFRRILFSGAAAWVCLHNHPSGCIRPSHEDMKLARDLWTSSQILSLEMLDFIVIGDGYFSFQETGFLQDFAGKAIRWTS